MNLDKLIEKHVESIIEKRVESVVKKMLATDKKISSHIMKPRNAYSKDSMAHEVRKYLRENGKVRITELIRVTRHSERQIRDVLYRLERNGHANYHTKKGYAWPTD